MRRALCAALLLVLVAGCSSDGEDDTAGPGSSTSSSGLEHSDDLHVHDTTAAPAAEQDAGAQGVRFLRSWARPDLRYAEWWAGIEPLMNAQGKQAYAATDPALVPDLDVTGAAKVEPGTVATSAFVWIPTSEGRFGLQMSRVTESAAWLVGRIYFPGSRP
ncbi:hypothetical protein ACLM5J_19705 [Nocardioides sp. Bht2]|uniref:hypothetical protein n=1 Tax=Nocardioides sp. Bht2 TaxID=3392297 RepID=UPI0039B4FBB5